LASPSFATHSVAVAKATLCPARQARIPSAIERWLLPTPESPIRITDSRSEIHDPSARAAIVACGPAETVSRRTCLPCRRWRA